MRATREKMATNICYFKQTVVAADWRLLLRLLLLFMLLFLAVWRQRETVQGRGEGGQAGGADDVLASTKEAG